MATTLYDIAVTDEEHEIGVSAGSAITDAIAITIDNAVITEKIEVQLAITKFLERYMAADIPEA